MSTTVIVARDDLLVVLRMVADVIEDIDDKEMAAIRRLEDATDWRFFVREDGAA
jgi:hypothetical protein